jgi:hypothetical protein
MLPLPSWFVPACLAVWLGRVLREQSDFLGGKNRLLRGRLGGKRIRLADAERRRPAALDKELGRKGPAAVAPIDSPRRSCAGIADFWQRSTMAASDEILGSRTSVERERSWWSGWPARTSCSDDQVVARPERYGFAATIVKPFNLDELGGTMQKVTEKPGRLDGRRVLSALRQPR